MWAEIFIESIDCIDYFWVTLQIRMYFFKQQEHLYKYLENVHNQFFFDFVCLKIFKKTYL